MHLLPHLDLVSYVIVTSSDEARVTVSGPTAPAALGGNAYSCHVAGVCCSAMRRLRGHGVLVSPKEEMRLRVGPECCVMD